MLSGSREEARIAKLILFTKFVADDTLAQANLRLAPPS